MKRREADPVLQHLYDEIFSDQFANTDRKVKDDLADLKTLYMHVSRRVRVFTELMATKKKTRELRKTKKGKESADTIDAERRRTSERELEGVADVFHISKEKYSDAISQLGVDAEEFSLQALLHFRKKIAKKWGDTMIQMEFAESFPSPEIVREIIADRIRLKKEELKNLQKNLKIAESRRIMGIASEDLRNREDEYIKAAKAEIYVQREITALEEYRDTLNAGSVRG